MRAVARSVLVLLILGLAAGPAFAVPVHVSARPTIAAPASHAPTGFRSLLTWLALPGAVGAIRIKDTGTLAKKFTRNASAAAGDYTTGVQAAGQDWQTNTAAAGDNYAAGTQAAIAAGRFQKGVQDAGAAKFVARASTLGAQRYPTGIAAAEGDWAKGVQPSLDMLKGMTLPPRRPKGDPGNQARANAVAAGLRALKVGK